MAIVLLKLLILGALTSCASKGHWKHSHMSTGTSEFSSSKLSYMFPDPNNSIQLEIFRTEKHYRGYLSVQSHPIVPSQNDPQKALVYFQIQEESFSFLATRHQGGHRVLLPEEALEKILEALLQNVEVTLETSGYRTKINPEGFSSNYTKFQNPSKFPKLIQLPL